MNSFSVDFKVFLHHIYEFQKGVRKMVLCTLSQDEVIEAESRLTHAGIAHFSRRVKGGNRANLFFGDEVCLKALDLFLGDRPLNNLTPEEDFIVGAMLGYDICVQCRRYCRTKQIQNASIVEVA